MKEKTIYNVFAMNFSTIFIHLYVDMWDFPGGPVVKNPPVMQETRVWSLSQDDTLGKEMTTPSSILAWEFPWTVEPDGL